MQGGKLVGTELGRLGEQVRLHEVGMLDQGVLQGVEDDAAPGE